MFAAKITRIPYFYARELLPRVAVVKYVCHRCRRVKENIVSGKVGWMISSVNYDGLCEAEAERSSSKTARD